MIRLALLLTALATGCATSAPTPAPTPSPSPTSLAAAGQRFDPAVDVAEIPTGAWMCDMGTVHFAAGEKHDGKCPVCGMNLTQKK